MNMVLCLFVLVFFFGCAAPSETLEMDGENGTGPIVQPADGEDYTSPALPIMQPDGEVSVTTVVDRHPIACTRRYEGSTNYTEQEYWVGDKYHIVFDGADGSGLPLCSVPENSTDYRYCLSPEAKVGYQQLITSHRLIISFFGEDWSLLKMETPDAQLEEDVAKGGSVTLGKENRYANLFYGERLEPYHIALGNVEVARGVDHYAVIFLRDDEGEVIYKTEVKTGESENLTINGDDYFFHVYRMTCWYGLGGSDKWAEAALLSERIVLEDGKTVEIGDRNCSVEIYWSGRGAAPDHLEAIVLDCG